MPVTTETPLWASESYGEPTNGMVYRLMTGMIPPDTVNESSGRWQLTMDGQTYMDDGLLRFEVVAKPPAESAGNGTASTPGTPTSDGLAAAAN